MAGVPQDTSLWIPRQGEYEIRPKSTPSPVEKIGPSVPGAGDVIDALDTLCEHLTAMGFLNVHFEFDRYERDGTFDVSVWGKCARSKR